MVTYSDDGGPPKRAPLADLLARVPGTIRRDRIELETVGRPLGPAPPAGPGLGSRPRPALTPGPARRPHRCPAGVQPVHQPGVGYPLGALSAARSWRVSKASLKPARLSSTASSPSKATA